MKELNANKDWLDVVSYAILGELPNPFVFNNGTPIKDATDWMKRRKEISKKVIDLQFGAMPPAPEIFTVEKLNQGKTHSSYKIKAGTKSHQLTFLMKIIAPAGIKRPMIINGDLCTEYYMHDGFVQAATEKGVGWVYFDRTELAHDIQNEGRRQGSLYDVYPDYDFGALAAWAWGYSRCVDALEVLSLPYVDLNCLVFSGHSRGGKAAILAGATDERAAIVNPNEACLGGSGCYRLRIEADYGNLSRWRSETLKDIYESTDFWFSSQMEQYIDREDQLPFDTHYLKGLVAPRVLVVSEATGDVWANPVGSLQTTLAATEIYKFLKCEENVYWYFRPGTHYHKRYDIEMLTNVICHVHDGYALSGTFYNVPFKQIPPIFSWRSK